MYMLDTNAVVMTISHPEWTICQKNRGHIGKDLAISSITYGELVYGIHKSRSPEQNRIALTQILLGIRIIDFDAGAAEHFGEIFADLKKRGLRIGDRDMLIATHARSLGYTLVTNNVREFSRVQGLSYEDWK